MYADDTVLMVNAPKIENEIMIMEENLYFLDLWYKLNKLTVNFKKSKFSILDVKGNKNCTDIKTIKFASSLVDRVSAYTYLGLEVDEGLTFENQCHKTSHLATFRLGQLNRIRPYLTKNLSLLIFKTMMTPIIDIFSTYYSRCKIKSLKKIDGIQSKGLKIVNRLGRRQNMNMNAQLISFNLISFEDTRTILSLISAFNSTLITSNIETSLVNTRAHDPNRKKT